MTVSGQFSCPPPGSFVAVSGQFLVAADNHVRRAGPHERLEPASQRVKIMNTASVRARKGTFPCPYQAVRQVVQPAVATAADGIHGNEFQVVQPCRG